MRALNVKRQVNNVGITYLTINRAWMVILTWYVVTLVDPGILRGFCVMEGRGDPPYLKIVYKRINRLAVLYKVIPLAREI